jgi:phenylpropionate dioxygenase-like ring-hydroxylating dioxygenase large terminal subunit
MDWSTLCENVMDPAHLPFTHHKTISSRAKAQPIAFGPLEAFSAKGFSAERRTRDGPGRLAAR